MMVAPDLGLEGPRSVGDVADYPLKRTAAMLNDRLGLYLSEEQQRGFATGLLIGTALGAAIFAWNITALVRSRM